MIKDFKAGDVVVIDLDTNGHFSFRKILGEEKHLFEITKVLETHVFVKSLTVDSVDRVQFLHDEIRHATLKEQYMRNGNSIVIKDKTYIIMNEKLVGLEAGIRLKDFDENMIWGVGTDNVVDKVFISDNYKVEDRFNINLESSKIIWQRKPKIELTDDEVVILKYVNTDFKYIARRNEGGELYAYVFEPKLDGYAYKEKYDTRDYEKLSPFEHIFRNITFESGPHLIADLIKENEK